MTDDSKSAATTTPETAVPRPAQANSAPAKPSSTSRKDALLKTIAEKGYDVGFGAKKTFATYDITEKAPGWIGFASTAVGIFGLVFESLAAKFPSAVLLVAGVSALYISFYKSADYEKTGKKLTELFNRLRDLYRSVKADGDMDQAESELLAIEREYYEISISKQIFLSDWYAHYKFFSQMQIGWIDEQLHFKFWSDKVPLTAKLFSGVVLISLVVSAVLAWRIASST